VRAFRVACQFRPERQADTGRHRRRSGAAGVAIDGFDILLTGVDDFFNRWIANEIPKRLQFQPRQRVDQCDALGGRHLNEAQFGDISQLANEFAVVCEFPAGSQMIQQLIKGFGAINELRRAIANERMDDGSLILRRLLGMG
jgi:hypothetical protein